METIKTQIRRILWLRGIRVTFPSPNCCNWNVFDEAHDCHVVSKNLQCLVSQDQHVCAAFQNCSLTVCPSNVKSSGVFLWTRSLLSKKINEQVLSFGFALGVFSLLLTRVKCVIRSVRWFASGLKITYQNNILMKGSNPEIAVHRYCFGGGGCANFFRSKIWEIVPYSLLETMSAKVKLQQNSSQKSIVHWLLWKFNLNLILTYTFYHPPLIVFVFPLGFNC